MGKRADDGAPRVKVKLTPHLYFETNDLDAAKSSFERLSACGRVTVPFAWQSWGGHYGNFTDAFGVQWAVSCVSTS